MTVKEHHCKLLDESGDHIYYNGIDWVMNNESDSMKDPDYIIIFCFKCGKKLN